MSCVWVCFEIFRSGWATYLKAKWKANSNEPQYLSKEKLLFVSLYDLPVVSVRGLRCDLIMLALISREWFGLNKPKTNRMELWLSYFLLSREENGWWVSRCIPNVQVSKLRGIKSKGNGFDKLISSRPEREVRLRIFLRKSPIIVRRKYDVN